MVFNMTLAERLRAARIASGFTQNELAENLGMNTRTYGSYERGERNVSTSMILNICKALNITSDYLLGITDSTNDNETYKEISTYTGLDDDTILILNEIKQAGNSQQLDIINDIIQNIDCWEDIYGFVNEIKNNQIMRRRKKRKRSNENV